MVGEWGTVSYIIQQIHTMFKGKSSNPLLACIQAQVFFCFFQFCDIAKLAIIEKKI
jgi:hypothetical protein